MRSDMPMVSGYTRSPTKVKLSWRHRLSRWLAKDTDHNAVEVGDDHTDQNHVTSTDPAITLKIFKASGGYVVESYSYNKRSMNSDSTVHVISDSENFDEVLLGIYKTEILKL